MSNKLLIIYGSTTGMTELVATEIKKTLEDKGIEVVMQNVIDSEISDLNNYEIVLFGVSTWDFGQLQYDFEPFYESLKEYDMSNIKFSVFGTGDKSYGESYCEAVRTVETLCLELGGELLYQRLEVECDLTEERLDEVRNWTEEIFNLL